MKRHLLLTLAALCIVSTFAASADNACFSSRTVRDTVTIISFNDFHGAFEQTPTDPGASAFVASVLALKAANPNPIVLSGGDNFGGSFFATVTRGKPMDEIFEMIDVKASAMGNHEFDYGQKYLADTAAVYSNFVAANITWADNGEVPQWTTPYRVIEVASSCGKPVRVGVIGLTTLDVRTAVEPAKLENINFEHPYDAAVRAVPQMIEAEKANGGVDIVIILCHIATGEDVEGVFEDAGTGGLPLIPGVDAVITGHSHKVVNQMFGNVPVIQAERYGRHFGKIQFEVVSKKNGKGRTVNFIGSEITDPQREGIPSLDKQLEEFKEREKLSTPICVAPRTIVHDRVAQFTEFTELGALLCGGFKDFFMKTMKDSPEFDFETMPVVCVYNNGSIRTNVFEGKVDLLAVGSIQPFGGFATAFKADGKHLRDLIDYGVNCPFGRVQACDIDVKLESDEVKMLHPVKIVYRFKDGREMEIMDDTPLVIVTNDFLSGGGDGYEPRWLGEPINEFNDAHYVDYKVLVETLQQEDVFSNLPNRLVKEL